ncbi:response regulator transcription factor [Chitinophaga pinensis]|uniref:Two component transcriptional regulator, LuxR family n=1 Tax=Chitinophaga pinensis (strain ATCC 43595 / DSM 2588 / LMG 13176 / NBRC 15968 / NCIMB 11800 / UQM 2034) TaxID=485918 RepID=A0A979G3F7_CHIPD|nr:response regulator transcription factor [Chitinophaga pinensis]ACU59878.1 two component transcriptional regulator, LuxR family [Chitinophaga pinensis DSM 2588]
MIKVVVVEDHPIMVEGLKNILRSDAGIEVSGAYGDGKSALQALEKGQPDVILMDVNLPDISGVNLCGEVKKKYEDIKIIALSIHDEQPVIHSMLQNGASGYVLKNALGNEIIHAIYAIMDGEEYLCSSTKEALKNADMELLKAIPRITRREKEILQLIGKGLTTMQIADQLFISTHTVESHRKNLMEKFGVNNTTSVVKLASEYKLL